MLVFMQSESLIAQRWKLMSERLDERQRRAFAAAEAKVLGRGGVAQVAAATGMARNTIMAGMRELGGSANEFLAAVPLAPAGATRRSGGGREWRPEGDPERVQVHDFIDPELGRANPYGVYGIGAGEGWVSVGTDHDTSAFAVQTIRRWWFTMGRQRYPKATELTITADGGGSNGYRVRLWKLEQIGRAHV